MNRIIFTIVHFLIAVMGLFLMLSYPFQDEIFSPPLNKGELIEVNGTHDWSKIDRSKYHRFIELKLSKSNVLKCEISTVGLSDDEILERLEQSIIVTALTDELEPSFCYDIDVDGETILSYEELMENSRWNMGLFPWLGAFLLFISIYEYRKLLKHWRLPKHRIR